MKSFTEQLQSYQQQHTNHLNRLLHYIGIPAILFSILMLLNWVSIDIARTWIIPFSWFFVLGGLIYYFMLNVRLALLMTVIIIPITFLAAFVARPTPILFSMILFLVLFIGGLGLLFTGHYLEKNKSGFMQSLMRLSIAPLFLLLEILDKLKLSRFFVA